MLFTESRMTPRLRKLRQRFGIAAPKVAVRTHLAWYWRWLMLLLMLGAVLASGAWVYDTGRRFAGFDREQIEQSIHDLRGRLETTRVERDAARGELEGLRAIANASESRLSIERAAQQKLAEQIRVLERDNARVREELATFESLLSADARNAQPLTVHRFKVEADVLPGEYRYRLLMMAAGVRRDRNFQGRLELVVTLTENGKNAMMVFPEQKDAAAAAFKLEFKHFQRVEGTFRVNPKAKVASVQVRVYEGTSGTPRVTSTASPV